MNGKRFTGINGGPDFKFDEAISFLISCEDQDEIDYYWDTLSPRAARRARAAG